MLRELQRRHAAERDQRRDADLAGLVAVANDARAAAGKPAAGFLNPLLYGAKGGVGTDIVAGNNKHGRCPKGFPAVVGWDAVTGLGTPLWSTLSALLEA